MFKFVFSAILAMSFCSGAYGAKKNKAEEGILAAIEKFEAAVLAQNAEALSQLYTVDAVLLIDGFPRFDGRAGVKAFWTGAFNAGLKSINLVPESIHELGPGIPEANEVGNATLNFQPTGGGAFTQTGRYLVTWKLVQGKWLLAFDITNNTVNTPVQ